MEEIDCRKLLWKYMEHVGAYEGSDFLYYAEVGKNEQDFTQEELDLLYEISKMGSFYED